MRFRLVVGKGNFGSVDGDSAAAMRLYGSSLRSSQKGVMVMDKKYGDFQTN
jgi:DNA gyrase/topoisomerase IV subunit A